MTRGVDRENFDILHLHSSKALEKLHLHQLMLKLQVRGVNRKVSNRIMAGLRIGNKVFRSMVEYVSEVVARLGSNKGGYQVHCCSSFTLRISTLLSIVNSLSLKMSRPEE